MSNATDHLALARDYIAKGDDYYRKAADEIAAWLSEDERRTQSQAASALGIAEQQVYRLLRARREGQVNWGSGSNKRDEVASKVLADPEQRRQVIASLPAGARASIAAEILQDSAVTDAAHDDTAFTAAVAGARSRIDAKRDQRHDERERIHRGIDEDELRFDRAKQAVRDGNYGDAERLLKGLAIDDERAGWLRKQADRHRYLADWFDAWADARPIQDADLADWLAG